mgnify:CR=1 FL=1
MSKRLSLEDFNTVKDITLLWGDMDAFQHINNIKHFRYFETARIHYMEEIGLFDLMAQTGVGPILAETSCKYITPLVYPDTISVGTRTTAIKDSEFHQEYLILSQKNEMNAAIGYAKIVAFDYQQQQRTQLPREIIDRIVQIDKEAEQNYSLS